MFELHSFDRIMLFCTAITSEVWIHIIDVPWNEIHKSCCSLSLDMWIEQNFFKILLYKVISFSLFKKYCYLEYAIKRILSDRYFLDCFFSKIIEIKYKNGGFKQYLFLESFRISTHLSTWPDLDMLLSF